MTVSVNVSREELERNRNICSRLNEELSDRGLTYHIESYGCQMNGHDSERLAGMLSHIGYTAAASKADADLILFNTCCVREHAELRVFGNIGALKKLKDEKPGLIIGVCGCMMQQQVVAERLFKRFPYVDMVFGTNELYRFPELFERVYRGQRVKEIRDIDGEIAEGLPALREAGVSSSIAITYGCNNFCSYCIVPYVRGRERSRDSSRIVDEAASLVRDGYIELTLLGQNVNSYSGDGGATDFPALLEKVNNVEGIERIRFMTSHPKDLSPGLIWAMARLEHVCPHIHLPVQSGNNRVLSAMNRHYTRERYLALVDDLRSGVADIEITTDIIVGFPGETEAEFNDTLRLMEQVGFSAAFTFMYSPRSGTKAAAMADQIDAETKKRRLSELNALQAGIIKEANKKQIGTAGTVLVEGCDRRDVPMAFGKLPNFRMVYFPGDERLIGTMQRVKVTAAQNNSLIGTLT